MDRSLRRTDVADTMVRHPAAAAGGVAGTAGYSFAVDVYTYKKYDNKTLRQAALDSYDPKK